MSYLSLSSSLSLIFVTLIIFIIQSANCSHFVEHDEDIIRRSIIYDKKTPDVFYCPLDKPNGMENMLVKAKPLVKLCEYQGQALPDAYKSDCYGNVDETVWACKEKKRIMKRKYPPGMDILDKYEPLSRTKRAELYDLAHPHSHVNVVSTSISQSSSSRSSSNKKFKF